MTREKREHCATLAHELWLSMWAHDESLQPEPERRAQAARWHQIATVAEELRLPLVSSAADVEVGDLLAVFDVKFPKGFRREDVVTNMRTAREIMRRSKVELYRVASKTDKTFQAVYMGYAPTSYTWDVDLGALYDYEPELKERMSGTTAKRDVARLGKLDDIVKRMRAHEGFAEWAKAFKAARAEMVAESEEYKRLQAEKAVKDAPVKEAMEQVNSLCGERLVSLTYDSRPTVHTWLQEQNRLDIYLAGLWATGRLSEADHAAVVKALSVLGIEAAPLQVAR